MIKKYVKKPIEVEAVQWTGDNTEEIEEFAKGHIYRDLLEKCLLIKTLEGSMKAIISDYIIKDVNGGFYSCKPDIFEKTYEEIK
nr:MAG TPA: PGDYG protein [Caudoviricetes sp.]